METVFQSSLLTGNYFLICPALAIIVICLLMPIYFRKPFHKCFSKKIVFILCWLLIIQLWLAASQIDAYIHVVKAYEEGNYSTVIGLVNNYQSPASNLNKHESFCVNEIAFSYGQGQGKNYFGYDKTAADGGYIHENGQLVSVGYVNYGGRNIIVELAITSDDIT